MIKNLRVIIGDTGERKKLVSDIENVHTHLHYDLKRNSERDLPHGSVRNSVLKNSLVTASERRGNLFRFLCLAHTDQIKPRLERCFSMENIRILLISSFASNGILVWGNGFMHQIPRQKFAHQRF